MRIVRYKGVSLRLHKNGIWYYQFTVRGNTYNSTLKTTRLGEAKAKLDSGLTDKVNRMRLGLEITQDTASITLLEAVEFYLKDVRSKIEAAKHDISHHRHRMQTRHVRDQMLKIMSNPHQQHTMSESRCE